MDGGGKLLAMSGGRRESGKRNCQIEAGGTPSGPIPRQPTAGRLGLGRAKHTTGLAGCCALRKIAAGKGRSCPL